MNSRLAFDRSPSMRREDDNGFLHVASSHITKATVNPYRGSEIPGWREAGLDPERIYYGLRDPEELKKSLKTWEGLPLHIEHHLDSADEPAKLTRVGAVGTGARWNGPYVDAPLTIWDGEAIDAVRDGSFRELSCAYFYTPDFTPGQYEGIPYDFVMRGIRGNHVALVEEGRAGRDVLVADAALDEEKKGDGWITTKNGKRIHFRDGEIDKGNVGQENDTFGPSYPDFKGKPEEAIEHLLKEKKGHVPGAFYKEGLGDIDLPYGRGGKKGFGLAHIIERRNEDGKDGLEFVKKLPEIIREGRVEEREGFPGRKYIVHDKSEVVVRLEWDGVSRNWVLTAYPHKEETSAKDGRLILTFDDNQKFIFSRTTKKEASGEHGKFSQGTCLREPGLVFSRPGKGAETSAKSIKQPPRAVNARGHTPKGESLMGRLRNLFRGAKDANPDIEREEVDLAQAIIDLHKVDPNTGEIVDITEDEDKAAEIRRLVGEFAGKLEPEELKKLTDALSDLAYSKATGDSDKPGPDEATRKAMDACGLDADDEGARGAFAEGVKYGESLIRNPAERAKLDREHESEGMRKAMSDCGLDAENPQGSHAFAEGVKYGEKLERNPEERKKLDREHEREGEEKALGRDEDKNAAISRILDEVPDLTPAQREKLTNSLQDLAYAKATGDADCRAAQDAALRRRGPALDAARIRAGAVAETQALMRRLNEASRAVRPLVGDIDPLAFDSAADIYAYALKENGVNPRDYPRQAWAGMVDVMRSGRALGSGSPRLAADSARAGSFEGPFAGLKNITVAD